MCIRDRDNSETISGKNYATWLWCSSQMSTCVAYFKTRINFFCKTNKKLLIFIVKSSADMGSTGSFEHETEDASLNATDCFEWVYPYGYAQNPPFISTNDIPHCSVTWIKLGEEVSMPSSRHHNRWKQYMPFNRVNNERDRLMCPCSSTPTFLQLLSSYHGASINIKTINMFTASYMVSLHFYCVLVA